MYKYIFRENLLQDVHLENQEGYGIITSKMDRKGTYCQDGGLNRLTIVSNGGLSC
jgi:hypothetical protein